MADTIGVAAGLVTIAGVSAHAVMTNIRERSVIRARSARRVGILRAGVRVCTTVHALASVRAVEDAVGISVPPTAELIRNIMMATLSVQDHVVHFYHLQALDWVDVVNALKADWKKTAELAQRFSSWHKNTPAYFADVQDTVKKLAASGLGIFANGYWGHPAYKLPPEANLLAVAH